MCSGGIEQPPPLPTLAPRRTPPRTLPTCCEKAYSANTSARGSALTPPVHTFIQKHKHTFTHSYTNTHTHIHAQTHTYTKHKHTYAGAISAALREATHNSRATGGNTRGCCTMCTHTEGERTKKVDMYTLKVKRVVVVGILVVPVG